MKFREQLTLNAVGEGTTPKKESLKERVKVSRVKNSERCPEVQSWLDLYSKKAGRSQNGWKRRT